VKRFYRFVYLVGLCVLGFKLFVGALESIFPSVISPWQTSWILVRVAYAIIVFPTCVWFYGLTISALRNRQISRALSKPLRPHKLKAGLLEVIAEDDFAGMERLAKGVAADEKSAQLLVLMELLSQSIGSGAFHSDGWAALDQNKRQAAVKEAAQKWCATL
jgi:hypothetical protein